MRHLERWPWYMCFSILPKIRKYYPHFGNFIILHSVFYWRRTAKRNVSGTSLRSELWHFQIVCQFYSIDDRSKLSISKQISDILRFHVHDVVVDIIINQKSLCPWMDMIFLSQIKLAYVCGSFHHRNPQKSDKWPDRWKWTDRYVCFSLNQWHHYHFSPKANQVFNSINLINILLGKLSLKHNIINLIVDINLLLLHFAVYFPFYFWFWFWFSFGNTIIYFNLRLYSQFIHEWTTRP